VTFHKIRHHAQAQVTSGVLIHHCALSLTTRRMQMAAQVNDFAGHCLLWRLLLLASAPDSGVSNQNFTVGFLLKFYLFFSGHSSIPPQSSALFWLLCMTRHSFRNAILVRYEWLLRWQQNRPKAMMWLLYKNSSYSRVPKMLLVWRLYVACYYPATPTDYPSTTRGMSMGRPVAVNINFCGYLWFSSICFVWIMWVQYATDNLLVKKSFSFTGQCWYFNTQWTPEQVKFKACIVRTVLVSWEECTVTKCVCIYRWLWRGLGGGGGTFWLLNEAWPSTVLQHSKQQQLTE